MSALEFLAWLALAWWLMPAPPPWWNDHVIKPIALALVRLIRR